MPTQFDLLITADSPARTAEFRLLDAKGAQQAYHQTDFKTFTVSQRRGLFDLRNYLWLFVEDWQEPAALAEIGVSIAQAVLGPEISTRSRGSFHGFANGAASTSSRRCRFPHGSCSQT